MPKVVINNKKGLVQETGAGTEINGGLALGVQVLAAPDEAEGSAAAGNLISEDATIIVVSQTNDANDRIYLPDPAQQPDGKVYFLIATQQFELSTLGTSIAVNDTAGVSESDGTYGKELEITSQTVMMCIKQSDTVWRVVTLADGGAAGT